MRTNKRKRKVCVTMRYLVIVDAQVSISSSIKIVKIHLFTSHLENDNERKKIYSYQALNLLIGCENRTRWSFLILHRVDRFWQTINRKNNSRRAPRILNRFKDLPKTEKPGFKDNDYSSKCVVIPPSAKPA